MNQYQENQLISNVGLLFRLYKESQTEIESLRMELDDKTRILLSILAIIAGGGIRFESIPAEAITSAGDITGDEEAFRNNLSKLYNLAKARGLTK